MAAGADAGRPPRNRVIKGRGRGGKQPGPAVDAADPDATKDLDQPDVLDWKARFGRRSPLSRKIITFNLVALCVLLSGVLYLNQFQGGLIELRTRSMVTEGRLISSIVSEELGPAGVSVIDRSRARSALAGLQDVTSARLLLFDDTADLVTMVLPEEGTTAADTFQNAADDQRQSAFIAIMSQIWERTSRIFAAQRSEGIAALTIASAEEMAANAVLQDRVITRSASTNEGELLLSVAVPIRYGDGPTTGALVLTTRPGDVDGFIRGEREKILQVFALAIISSIMLSLVLANTIVRPLRDLSEAAHEGGTRSARQVNPERIKIPDLTARPDEIGYLSGAMQLMTSALYNRVEANESFAADVAHEIKNPLTSLRSAVETMPYARKPEDRARLLDVIKQDVGRLDRLVTDISNASRLDSELVRDKTERFDLHLLLTNLIAYNVDQAAERGVVLQAEFDPKPLFIEGLEGRIAQIVINLITNAVSFCEKGEVVRVKTELRPRRMVRILVEDEGPGIRDENVEDIFKRFYSERPETEAFGNHSGLGLSISKQIAVAHGGDIWAENIRPDGTGPGTLSFGARFVVELPL